MLRRLARFFVVLNIFFFLNITPVLAVPVWDDPGGPPVPNPATHNAAEPINVSNSEQLKEGSLWINSVLSAHSLFATDKLGVGSLITGTALNSGTIDSTAVLDVNGQIRIRGLVSCGSFCPATDRVLTTLDGSGLGKWKEFVPGISLLTQGPGINLIPDPMVGLGDTITASGTIAIDPTYTQRRITPCATPYGAIRVVGEDGTPTCQDFVTTVQTNTSSGLNLTIGTTTTTTTNPTSGPVELRVSAGAGVLISPITGRLTPIIGNGLTNSGGQVKFSACASGQTWKYNTGNGLWECSSFPVAASNQPGSSILYIKSKSSATPANCPSPATCTSSTWCEAPRTVPSGTPQWTTDESIGHATLYNKVRVCYRTGISCQVMDIKSTTTPPTSCPSGWTNISGAEYGPLGVGSNYINHCYLCQ